MRKIKCECGTEYTYNSGDLRARYVKRKPRGVYRTQLVVFCPKCERGAVVKDRQNGSKKTPKMNICENA